MHSLQRVVYNSSITAVVNLKDARVHERINLIVHDVRGIHLLGKLLVRLIESIIGSKLFVDLPLTLLGLFLLLFDLPLGASSLGTRLHEGTGCAFGNADVGGVLEDLSDGGVHLDEHLVLLEELLVPGIASRLHPQFKILADQSVNDVDHILSG